MWRPIMVAALAAMVGVPAGLAAEPTAERRAKLIETGTNLAILVGVADFCHAGEHSLLDFYLQSLPHFGLASAEIGGLATMMEERRRQSFNDAQSGFAAKGVRPGECPQEIVGKVRAAMQETENAWVRVTKNETGVDLRQSAPPSGHATGAKPAAASGSTYCVVGAAVSVLYGGQWYPAKVLKGPDNMGTCLVSYDGFGSNWDEWVSANRIRPAPNVQAVPRTAPADTGGSARPAGQQSVPPGTYSCYTFDNGQLNYTFTDVVIESGNRYSVGGKGGSYTLSGEGSMTFTGTMTNATGKFSIKNGGKPNIDLIFNGDPRASMSCSKAR